MVLHVVGKKLWPSRSTSVVLSRPEKNITKLWYLQSQTCSLRKILQHTCKNSGKGKYRRCCECTVGQWVIREIKHRWVLYLSSTVRPSIHAALPPHISMFTLETDWRRERNWLSYHCSDWQNKSDSVHVSSPQTLMKVMNGHEQITPTHSLSWLSSHTHLPPRLLLLHQGNSPCLVRLHEHLIRTVGWIEA